VRRHVLLLRHAKSAWDDPSLDDHDRPLARRGQEAGERLREFVADLPVRPDVVLCSSAVRTVQTLDAIRPVLGRKLDVRIEDGLYLADDDTWLRRLRQLDDGVAGAMVVGHNPGLEDLAATLVGSGDRELRERLNAKFPTDALATISFRGRWSDLAEGGGRLDAYFVPRRQRPPEA
jgi:phosphohistidine phosphatase